MPLADIKAVISDMDGVLWRGDQKLPSMVEFFQFMRSHHIPFVLATNNSGRHTDNYVQKLAKMGVKAITPKQLVTSATATVDYIKAHHGENTRLHVIGNEGLFQTLEEANFIITDTDVEAVVAGLDFNFTYEKARQATLLLRNHGAAFIGTNPDSSFPSPDGLVPGAGSIIRMIQEASDVTPAIIGKPKPAMFEVALARLGSKPEETLMIGDRINTDIEGGNNAGLQTAMVLTGVNQRSDITDIQPDYIFEGLTDLLNTWSASL